MKYTNTTANIIEVKTPITILEIGCNGPNLIAMKPAIKGANTNRRKNVLISDHAPEKVAITIKVNNADENVNRN